MTGPMKPGPSSLNPYASSYIPLSQRGSTDGNKDTTQNQLQGKVSQNCGAHGTEIFPIYEDNKLKAQPAGASYGSLSHNPSEMTEKEILDEEFDMALAFLVMTFPSISDECLSDVYLANNGDLEATVDMLNHLERYTIDSDEDTPGSSNSGNVSEPGSSSKAASKLKKSAEVGG